MGKKKYLNTELLHSVIDILGKLQEEGITEGKRIILRDNETGLKIQFYPMMEHYWRLDIFDMKKRDLTPVLFVEKKKGGKKDVKKK